MKVYLTVGKEQTLSGYLNVDPLVQTKIKADVDMMADEGELEELIVDEYLDYFDLAAKSTVLNGLVKLLAHQGEITIIGTDINEVARQVYKGAMDTISVNKALYGDPQALQKRGLLSLEEISLFFQQIGYPITSKSFSGIYYVVKAVRP